MSIEGSPSKTQVEISKTKPEVNSLERNRLIAHLGRTFARRYDIQVLPSGRKGVWACGLDPKVTKLVHMEGVAQSPKEFFNHYLLLQRKYPRCLSSMPSRRQYFRRLWAKYCHFDGILVPGSQTLLQF